MKVWISSKVNESRNLNRRSGMGWGAGLFLLLLEKKKRVRFLRVAIPFDDSDPNREFYDFLFFSLRKL